MGLIEAPYRNRDAASLCPTRECALAQRRSARTCSNNAVMRDISESQYLFSFDVRIAVDRDNVSVMVEVPPAAPREARSMIFETLVDAFAVAEVSTATSARELLQGVEKLLAREDVVILRRRCGDYMYPLRLQAALQATRAVPQRLH